jgi:hypothetical protein
MSGCKVDQKGRVLLGAHWKLDADRGLKSGAKVAHFDKATIDIATRRVT